jgi:large subunit ribosomal protein L19
MTTDNKADQTADEIKEATVEVVNNEENSVKKEANSEETVIVSTAKDAYADVIPGAFVKVYQKIIEKKGKETKERIQIFEGIVLARKHGNQAGATVTVRKIAKGGYGVEKIYPLHSPIIDKIEVSRQAIVRRAKLMHLRDSKKKLKMKK